MSSSSTFENILTHTFVIKKSLTVNDMGYRKLHAAYKPGVPFHAHRSV
jgi:hypothetical protein